MNQKIKEIFIITEGKAGHLSQSKGLASLLSCEKNIHIINVNLKRGLTESLFRTAVVLNHRSGKPSTDFLWNIAKKFVNSDELMLLEKKIPDMIISAGTIPSSFNVIISKKFNCPNITAMKPSLIPIDAFKLAILPQHDVPPHHPSNVLAVSTSPNECREEIIKNDGESFANENGIDPNKDYWAFFLGGESKVRHFPNAMVLSLLKRLLTEARKLSVKCLITTSRRTNPQFEESLSKLASDFSDAIAYLQIYSKNPKSTSRGILALASHVFITEDSVSMVSESLWAKRRTILIELPPKKNSMNHDKIEKFKTNLINMGLIRTISDRTGIEKIEETIKYEPRWYSFSDIESISSAVNQLI